MTDVFVVSSSIPKEDLTMTMMMESKKASNNKAVAVSVSSPTSVAFDAPQNVVEPIVLNNPATTTTTSTCTTHATVQQVNDKTWGVCQASEKSIRTINPIRAIVDPIVKNIQTGTERGDGKDLISLALGDPTVGGNLPPCQVAMEQIVDAVRKPPHAAGYVNACGTSEALKAIAEYHSYAEHTITSSNVIIASGCSGALELALTALLDPGTILLVPQPGFPLYQVIAESHGASVLHYRLDPNKQWECDLNHLEDIMIQSNTRCHFGYKEIRGIVVNNPSNPTGAVFSERHLIRIMEFCERHKLPLVADEVYGDLTFGNNRFHPMAQVAAKLGRHVPVITASGLAKQFLLPGWRIGWITFHDNIFGSLREVEAGAHRLAQVILGASHLAQTVIPSLLSGTSEDIASWKESLRTTLGQQANYLCTKLSCCDGLDVVAPQGAMYAMVKIDKNAIDIVDDMEFSTKLLREENVFVLPGSAFGVRNVFRVVFCSDEPILLVAAERIADFCRRHAKA